MNINVKMKLFVYSIFGVFLITSCDNNVEEITKIDNGNPIVSYSFSNDVKPIIDNKCIECHNTGGQFPDLTNYNSIRNNASSVKTQVVNRTMPLGGSLTNAQIEAIRSWIDAGALNN